MNGTSKCWRFRSGLTFIPHVAIDLRSCVSLSKLNSLHVTLHDFLYDIAQRLVLGQMVAIKQT